MLNVNYHTLSEQVHHYAQSIFKANTDSGFVYHDISHTQTMAAAAEQIATHYKLNEHDFFIVYTASWFHDLGYFSGSSNHEEKGAAMAEIFLKENGVDKETIDSIRNCILATQLPQNPLNLLEQIVCDADLFHLGTADFDERNKLMRKEAIKLKGTAITKDAWRDSTITFLEKHSYHTDYAKQLLAQGKQDNLNRLKAKQSAHLLQSPQTDIPAAAFIPVNVQTPSPNKHPITEKRRK
jgi:predicted metal-dependent HD superfamily phosphohydrolase